jgi:hypothetical protein
VLCFLFLIPQYDGCSCSHVNEWPLLLFKLLLHFVLVYFYLFLPLFSLGFLFLFFTVDVILEDLKLSLILLLGISEIFDALVHIKLLHFVCGYFFSPLFSLGFLFLFFTVAVMWSDLKYL